MTSATAPRPSDDDTEAKAALAGVRVLDLSRLLPGPFATLLLSDLGAEVLKVEDPQGGDYARWFPPLLDDAGGALFHALNRGKRSVAINLRSDEGRERLLELCEHADVLVESFRPGVLERLQLGPDMLRERFPRLIVCRISGYGQTGPDALRAGHDINYAARSGVLGMMESPTPLPMQVGDLAGGAWPAAFQILAALYARTSSGQGSVIDVSMTHFARSTLIMPLASYATTQSKIGSGHDWLNGAVPCYQVYKTADGYLSVGALEPKFWHVFCDVVGLPALRDEGLTQGDQGRAVRATLAQHLAQKTTAAWMELLGPADCCCEPVVPPETAGEDPQLQIGGLEVDVALASVQHRLPAVPLSLAIEKRPTTAGPLLGAHEGWATTSADAADTRSDP